MEEGMDKGELLLCLIFPAEGQEQACRDRIVAGFEALDGERRMLRSLAIRWCTATWPGMERELMDDEDARDYVDSKIREYRQRQSSPSGDRNNGESGEEA
jgi:hypothetical protein